MSDNGEMFASDVVARETEIIADLDELGDQVLQMQYILGCAQDVCELPEEMRTSYAKVPGCLSNVWVDFGRDGRGRFRMRAESDALIVKGLLGIVTLIIDGASIDDVVSWDPRLMECEGLQHHLVRRRQGVSAVIEQARCFAKRQVEMGGLR